MDNRIFFNPGDSIANIHDYNEAVRKGQIFKKEQQAGDLVIAKGPDDEEYAIFYANDALPPTTSNPNPTRLRKTSKQKEQPQTGCSFYLVLSNWQQRSTPVGFAPLFSEC